MQREYLVSDSPGLVNFVLNLPERQVKFFEEFKLQKNCEINSAQQNVFGASSACPTGKLLK